MIMIRCLIIQYIYIVIWSVKAKIVFVIKLTVTFEENFDWTHQRKLEKSEDQREQCARNGWITNVFPIEVRSRDFIANSTSVSLSNLGLPSSDKRKCMEKIQDNALTASAWIWQSHRVTKIWQSLVVLWDIAQALWASGNDASAPKPCLNPKPSSDEGFVGSNAVIQTSVIVWYLYIYIYIYIYIYMKLFQKALSPTVIFDLYEPILHRNQDRN